MPDDPTPPPARPDPPPPSSPPSPPESSTAAAAPPDDDAKVASPDVVTPPAAEMPKPSRRGLRIGALVIVVIAVLVVAIGLVVRMTAASKLKDRADDSSVPTVDVVAPGRTQGAATLDLPGRLEAYSRAPIFARVSGYLKDWKVDIGGHVKAGQLLAEIETPDLDQQLLQAKADLASAKASAQLAASTSKRWQALLASDSVSRQEADEKANDVSTRQASVSASQANLDRYLAMKAFARIVAPFDGVVTSRTTDVGALINAGGGGPELFTVSDIRRLRVYVSVPQSYVSVIGRGTEGALTVPEHPGRTYRAVVETTARSVDVASGTMLIQLVVDNAAGELLPGGFANVSLSLPKKTDILSIPPGALIFDKRGLHVATVGPGDKVKLKTVTIARDLGKTIELSSGLDADDRVIDSPPDGIGDGDAVKIAKKQADGKDGKDGAKGAPADGSGGAQKKG